jgi:four helix bundle protein
VDRSNEPGELAEDLKKQARQFALDVIRLCRRFPKTMDGYVVSKQLIKSATSTAANYRAACPSRSPTDFVSRISVVAEEADESQFWLDVTIAGQIVSDSEARKLLQEASELTAIFTASRNTAKHNLAQGFAVLRSC